MQHPTCTNIRIRSVHDAHKIFYAVQQGLLQMVTRRLDADERMQLRTGCVYAWEERSPHTELTGLGIERFTEGRRWSPSRVRDEFLFYYEKYSPSPDCANPHPPRDWDPLVKQTYSVWVDTDKGRRKWHMTAYFTQATIDQLGSVDDIRSVKDLVVPENAFKSTRVTKGRGKNDENRIAEGSKSSSSSAGGASKYAPLPAPTLPDQPEQSGQILMFQPYTNHDASASHQQHQDDAEKIPAQPFSAAHSSNPNPSFGDLNQYQTSSYRPLLPSSHPRPSLDHPHSDYISPHEQLPVRFTTNAQRTSTSLSQVRSGSERAPPHLPTSVSSTSTPHSTVNTMQPYAPNDQTLQTTITSQWNPVSSAILGPQNSSVYYGGDGGDLDATHSNSYPVSHEITANPELEPHQTMAPYLNLVHSDISGNNCVPREPLPSLSILQETYSFSYDLSVAMVAQNDMPTPSLDAALSHKTSPSSSNSSQVSRVLGPESSKPGGSSRDLDLAPLNTLARRQPYRREPMDDRALRMLWPRSP